MTKRAGAALLLTTAALFLIANRAAYKGYFQDDELDNIAWTREIPASVYPKAVPTPRFFVDNFRPMGHRKTPLAYVRTDAQTPLWQLGPGWHSQKEGFRWASSHARATLAGVDRPRGFELVVNVSPDHIRQTGPIAIALALNGQPAGKRQVPSPGLHTLLWPAPEEPAPPQVAVDLEVTPEYRPSNGDTRQLGAPVVAFGFR